MIRLVTTELTRLRWRRSVVVLITAAFLVPLMIGIGTAWNSRPYSTADIEHARVEAMAQPGFARDVRSCEKRPRNSGVRSADLCEDQVVRWHSSLYREPLGLRNELTSSAIGVASFVLILLILVGTTFAGADWASGSMSNQLLFEPRRFRVWMAKAIAVSALAAMLAAVVLTLYWLGLYGIAAARDLPIPSGLLGEVAWMVARCAFLATAGALAGYALTMFSRSTVFTLGTMFAVSVASTFVVAALPLGPDSQRWLPSNNLLAVMQGQASYWRETSVECHLSDPGTLDAAMRSACSNYGLLSVWDGLPFVLVPIAVVMALSVWSFRRRDVA